VLVLFVTSWIVMLAWRLWHEPSLGDLMNSIPSFRALSITVTSPWNVVFRGIVLVVATPLAEEVFWRGYVLDRLRTLTHWSVALLIHSVLFALYHLPDPLMCVAAFFYGAVFGVWRIRFRSLLPPIVAHAVLNGIAFAPKLTQQFSPAINCYPKICDIDLLANEPAEEAVPALIAFMGDADGPVSVRAVEVLSKSFAGQAEPYLKEALRSNDSRTLENVLFAVELGRYSRLAPEVHAIAYESSDRLIQLRATGTLTDLRDEAGLRDIADRHPDEIVRRMAKKHLDYFADTSQKGP
jgi:hypothetical protein